MQTAIDYSQYQTEDAEPVAGSVIQTYRAIGYNLQTAIADIIDNSIAAQAKNVWIQFQWEGEQSYITITDDGIGMSADELNIAMRAGSQSPLTKRSSTDLGRFGLGLKTASFSQCKRLTVLSRKKAHALCYRCWDIDYVTRVGKWKLLIYLSNEGFAEKLPQQESGTTVVWEFLDKLVQNTRKDDDRDLNNFLKAVEFVKHHLAVVFHRYIEQKKLVIWLNERPVIAWDPYLRGEAATQPLNGESFMDGKVNVKPYVLPHHSKINKPTFERASGPQGWNAQQGFYIYRNERLLVAADWLGMFKKEEHYKLARIMIDIPNSVDNEWQIDIKKSVARPPSKLRKELRRIASYTRSRAVEIYRHRGKKLQRSLKEDFVMLWHEKVRHGKRFYEINREHPCIKAFFEEHKELRADFNRVLRLVEETVPLPLIMLNEAEQADNQMKPFEGAPSQEITTVLKAIYEAFLTAGKTPEDAKKQILCTEPFSYYPELMEDLDDSIRI